MVMNKTALPKKKEPKMTKAVGGLRQMTAGEFKAKCLAIMDEVNKTRTPGGHPHERMQTSLLVKTIW
jgi:hypothetical protein